MKQTGKRISVIIGAVLEAAVGVLLLISPARFTAGIITVVGVVLVISGVLPVKRYFSLPPVAGVRSRLLTKGILQILVGIFCVVNPEWFLATFPVLTALYGAAILVLGVAKAEETVDQLRLKNRNWIWHAMGSGITLTFAAVILFNPFASTNALWIFIGVSLIGEAVFDFVGMCMGDLKTKDI